ncbi:MAG: hypothetical protein RL661_1037 [Pseudomonadota bacterium]|jgi:hypothetical protein
MEAELSPTISTFAKMVSELFTLDDAAIVQMLVERRIEDLQKELTAEVNELRGAAIMD